MSKKVMKYILLFLVFALPLLLPFTPITNSKYIAKKSKKIIINLEQPKYKIRFKANGGVGADVLQEFTYKEAQALMHNPFTYTAHGFLDWNTEPDGSGESYEDEETIINLSSVNGVVLEIAPGNAYSKHPSNEVDKHLSPSFGV